MFEVGEKIVHNKMGICNIVDITKINDMEYYILKSNDTKIMIPVIKADSLIRKTITKKNLDNVIKKIPTLKVEFISDFKTRIKKYEDLLKSGETEKLIFLIKIIQEQKRNKKNLTLAEKGILKLAEKLVYEECALVLDVKYNEVEKHLFEVS